MARKVSMGTERQKWEGPGTEVGDHVCTQAPHWADEFSFQMKGSSRVWSTPCPCMSQWLSKHEELELGCL
jgi:hypothetical protein